MYRCFFKRILDFILAFFFLLFMSPIFLVTTICLHFANKGTGAFFFQERPGKGGKIFRIVKYKTMTDERDVEGHLLPDAQRLTKVGRFVRSISIDELPQLINVLKGDMAAFAQILGKGWEDKKKMAGAISNPMIQEAFDVATTAGAIAGKVSGAGGGGFIMFFVEPTRKKEVINALRKLDGFVMPFNFTEGGAHGWKIYPTDKVSTLSK